VALIFPERDLDPILEDMDGGREGWPLAVRADCPQGLADSLPAGAVAVADDALLLALSVQAALDAGASTVVVAGRRPLAERCGLEAPDPRIRHAVSRCNGTAPCIGYASVPTLS
jgi:hypothetical protein